MFPFPIGICARSLCSLRMLIYFVSEIVVQNICNLPVNDNGPISMYSKCQKRVLKNVQNTEPLCSMHLVHVVTQGKTPHVFFIYLCHTAATAMHCIWSNFDFWPIVLSGPPPLSVNVVTDQATHSLLTYMLSEVTSNICYINANFIPVILPKKLHIKQIMIVVRVSIEKNPYKIG